MPLLRHSVFPRPAPPAGILLNRQTAHPALMRMLSRARRQQTPLLLVRIAPPAVGTEATAWGDSTAMELAQGHGRFLGELAAELRLNDLAWWEPGGVVLALLEGATDERAVLDRLERRALLAGTRPRWRAARFPQQGLTLQALLEEVQWRP